MTLVIDTNAYSALLSGVKEAAWELENAENVVVPVIVAGELLSGFSQGTRYAENARRFDAFLNLPGVALMEADLETARVYASLMKALRKAGTPIPMNDVWIAAIALRSGGMILSADKHFDEVPGIMRIEW